MDETYDPEKFLHREITDRIIRVYYDVFNELGSGFLESVYHRAMQIGLEQAGLLVRSRFPIPVHFRGQAIGVFEADLLVEEKVILELKAVAALVSAHEKQLLHYLRATAIEVGLLLNFGSKAEIRRFAYSNTRKVLRPSIPEAPGHTPEPNRAISA